MNQWHVSLSQEGSNIPTINYELNQLGITPILQRVANGLYLIKFNGNLERKLFAIANPIIGYQNGIESPSIDRTTTISVNDIDGEITILNKINGNYADGFDNLNLIVTII